MKKYFNINLFILAISISFFLFSLVWKPNPAQIKNTATDLLSLQTENNSPITDIEQINLTTNAPASGDIDIKLENKTKEEPQTGSGTLTEQKEDLEKPKNPVSLGLGGEKEPPEDISHEEDEEDNKKVEIIPEDKKVEIVPEDKKVEIVPEDKKVEIVPEDKKVEVIPDDKKEKTNKAKNNNTKNADANSLPTFTFDPKALIAFNNDKTNFLTRHKSIYDSCKTREKLKKFCMQFSKTYDTIIQAQNYDELKITGDKINYLITEYQDAIEKDENLAIKDKIEDFKEQTNQIQGKKACKSKTLRHLDNILEKAKSASYKHLFSIEDEELPKVIDNIQKCERQK